MMLWQQLGPDVALLKYDLRRFGIDFGRIVTLLRLRDGRLLLHSTAPFGPEEVASIRRFGEPAWLVEATGMHNTFARTAQLAFPRIPYLTPAPRAGLTTTAFNPPPRDWAGEIDLIRIEGLRRIEEYAFFHRASRTLVLADLLFHFPAEMRGWQRFFVKTIMRLPRLVGISFLFRSMIRDRERFADSARKILAWDFRQIVVAHREPIVDEAKSVFVRALRERGFAREQAPGRLNARSDRLSNNPS